MVKTDSEKHTDEMPVSAAERDPILVIDLTERWTECHRCGAETPCKWGLPVDESGSYVPTWYQGEWAGVPACKACYEWHEALSEKIHRPFEAPLC